MKRVALASGSAQGLNNLAAFLCIPGGETAGLPVLITLDARYPNNSTLANNTGQCWYGLGAIREAAQASMHNALRGGYTEAKEMRLRRYGGEVTAEDARLNLPRSPMQAP